MAETGEKKENRRVRYTRMALRESLLSLLQQFPISKISVSRVCEQADVNRSTFYLYYKDVNDLLKKIEDELYVQIAALVDQSRDILPNSVLLRQVFEVIYKHRDLCRVLFGEYGDKTFLRKVGSLQRERMLREWTDPALALDETALEYLHAFFAFTNIGIIERWVSRDFQETPEQLAQLATVLLSQGVTGYLKGRPAENPA